MLIPYRVLVTQQFGYYVAGIIHNSLHWGLLHWFFNKGCRKNRCKLKNKTSRNSQGSQQNHWKYLTIRKNPATCQRIPKNLWASGKDNWKYQTIRKDPTKSQRSLQEVQSRCENTSQDARFLVDLLSRLIGNAKHRRHHSIIQITADSNLAMRLFQ